MCYAYDLRVRSVQNVDIVDADDDVAHLQSRQLGRRSRLDGRHDDGSGAMDAESKLARFPLDEHDIVAFCFIREIKTDL